MNYICIGQVRNFPAEKVNASQILLPSFSLFTVLEKRRSLGTFELFTFKLPWAAPPQDRRRL